MARDAKPERGEKGEGGMVSAAGIEKAGILVAGGDPDTGKAAARALESAGYRVLIKNSGRECLQALEAFSPDMVFLDPGLPDTGAAEVCRWIRQSPRFKDTVIAVVSGPDSMDKTGSRELMEWADDFIPGPLSVGELPARIRVLERLKEARDRAAGILGNMEEGFLALDDHSIVTSFNRSAEDLLGRKSEDAVGLPVLEAIPEAKGTVFEERYRKAAEEKHHDCFDVSLGSGPRAHWVRIRIFPEERGVAVYVQGVTEHRRTAEALKLNEARLESLLRLSEMHIESQDRLAELALEESIALTGSESGFINFLSDDETMCIKAVYSRNTLEQCALPVEPWLFRIRDSGLWSEACRQRSPVIINDYSEDHPGKLGLPQGHIPIKRLVSVPVFENSRVAAVAALANKETAYDEGDVRQFMLFMQGMWNIMQRKRTEETLKEREKSARAMLNANIDSALLLDTDGVIIDINRTAAGVLNGTVETLIGQSVYDYLPQDVAENRKRYMREVVTRKEAVRFEDWNEGRIIEHSLYPVLDEEGEVLRAAVYARDITLQRQAQERLRESEQRYRRLVETIPYGIEEVDLEGRLVFANDPYHRMMGYRPGELVGKCFWDREASPEKAERIKEYFEYIKREQPVPEPYFSRNVKKDGDVIDILVDWNYKRDKKGDLEGFISVVTDITERSRAEEALKESENKLRRLSDQLIRAQEKERRRISVELHDEMGQALMALKLQLRAIYNKLGLKQEELKSTVSDSLQYVDDMAGRVRRLSRELRPAVLEDLGLQAALGKLIEESMGYTDTEIYPELDEIAGLLSEEQEVLLFRVFQEAVTNALRHARAKKIWVKIRKRGGGLHCLVRDNGRGFAPKSEGAPAGHSQGLGLTTMEERVSMLGGELSIHSGKGAGTRIEFAVPLRKGSS